MKKVLWAFVLVSLIGTGRCYNADFAGALGGLPVVGPMVQPTQEPPAYVNSIGTAASNALPETDFATWFPAETPADPYNAKLWREIELFVTIAGTNAGWAETCKKVSEAAGGDRAANAKLGALACSSDPTVTQMQQFAAQALGAQAAVALWMKGELNGSVGAIQARQAELRVVCAAGVIGRQGPGSIWPDACTKAFDSGYTTGDGPATFAALGEAYGLAATEIARLDPEVDAEPGYFGAKAP